MSWSNTTKAKSDQLNADDLIGGDVTIKITNVKVDEKSDQSGIIYYEGDNGKPYKPCKSMRRVIELKWGSDEKKFIGRSMTLTRDATVKWAGEEVGGIRITHMSDMKDDSRFMLTYSKGNKRPYKVEKLVTIETSLPPEPLNQAQVKALEDGIDGCFTMDELKDKFTVVYDHFKSGRLKKNDFDELTQFKDERKNTISDKKDEKS